MVRAMRIMTGEAFAVFDRLMFCFCGFRKGLVAGEAKGLAFLQNHFGMSITMRIVAGRAFTVLSGLMFEFYLGEKIVMAGEADLPLRSFHFHREP